MAELAPAGDRDRYLLQGAGPFPLDLPRQPMRAAAIAGGDALWLGPEEWLLLLAPGTVPQTGDAGSLVDVSHRTLGFRLSGRGAALLLNGGVPLDLALPAFPVGGCTRTIFEKAEIVLWRQDEMRWHVEVARSFVPYFRDLLTA